MDDYNIASIEDKKNKLKEDYEKSLEKMEYEKEKALCNLEIRKKKAEIRKINAESSILADRIRKLTTSKIIMYLIFINCSIIEIFSMRAMIYLQDLSPLPTLIASVITESVSYAIYCAKSYSGTREEKRHELEVEKFELDKEIKLNTIEEDKIEGVEIESHYDEE